MSSKGKLKKAEAKASGLMQFADYILGILTAIYVFLFLVAYPLYFEHVHYDANGNIKGKYFNMGEAKYNFFKNVSGAFTILLMLAFVIWLVAYYKEISYEKIFKGYSITDWFAVGFLLVSFLSYLLSSDHYMALNGYIDWNMGLIAQTIFVLLYFFVSRFGRFSRPILKWGMLTCFIVCLLAVLMRFGFDPLGMYDDISPADIEKFVSTIGQTSWYSSYAVLIYALGMFWYFDDNPDGLIGDILREQKVSEKVIHGINSFIYGLFVMVGAASIVTVNSDSAFVALTLIFMVLFWYGLESNEKFSRFLELAVLVFTTFRLVGLLQDMFPERLIEHVADTEAICQFLNHSTATLIIWIGLVVVYIAYRVGLHLSFDKLRRTYKFQVKKFVILRKIMVIAAIFVLWLVALLIILTTNHKLPASMSGMYNSGFFNFADAWGNHRGFNWKMAVVALNNASIKDLFVGVGPDCFSLAMSKYCNDLVSVYWHGQTLACAHNEFLNMTVTEGILGITAYLGMMISSASRLGRLAYKRPEAIGCLVIILAYIGHNFFCYQTCCSAPYVFIFMGIGESIIRKEKQSA